MKKIASLLAVAAFSIVAASSAYASTSEDFSLDQYESELSVDDASIYGYSQSEGSGSDLDYVKTYTALYSEGVFQESDTDTGDTYSFASVSATNWFNDSYELKGTHRAQCTCGEYIKRSSYASW